MEVEVTRTAAHSQKPFGSTCRRCREPGHKARECNKAEKKLGQSQVEKTSHGRSCEPKQNTRDHGRAEEMGRVGKMGETPHGRDEAAAATGPGMKTTDHHRTDGVSLATLASSPRVNQKVVLNLVKPPPSPLSVASTTPLKWTQPHANELRGNGRVVAGRDDDDDDCQAHECANDPVHRVDTSMDETAATATVSTFMDTAAPHTDHAKATWDQGDQVKTSTSAPSALRDHTGKDAMTPDPPRLSEDPADATGDDEHRPDAPTEPPDMPEGTRE